MTPVEVGSVWMVRGNDMVLAEKRYIKRGRHSGGYELRLLPMKKMEKAIGFHGKMRRDVVPTWMGPASRTYTKDEIAKALGEGFQAYAERDERVEARKDEQRKALDFSKVEPGDEVHVNYSDGRRWEKVAAVNYGTGKFAIKRPGYVKKEPGIVEYLLEKHEGIKKTYADRSLRWLGATLILEVRKAEKKP